MNTRIAPRRMAVERALRYLSWTVLTVGLSAMQIATMMSHASSGIPLLNLCLGVFFPVLLLRLLVAASIQRARRAALVALVIGTALWSLGSMVLNGVENADVTTFPGPGEWLFLAGYGAIAIYLLFDTPRRLSRTLSSWLESIVICCGTACLAGTVLLTPAAASLGKGGLAGLLALLYPLIDITLGVVVVAQLILHARGGLRESAGLISGLTLFAVADSEFITNLPKGVYHFDMIAVCCWGIGFALIVGNACRPRRVSGHAWTPRGGAALMLGAGISAVMVLAFQPAGTVRAYLTVPAIATLLAAGWRLTLALRAASRATEAFRLSQTDDLTLLPNRRFVMNLLDDRLPTEEPLSLMIMDLDGFKDINDTLGHLAGDSVLKEVATRVSDSLPRDIAIARLGGDEFAAVVRSTDDLYLMEVANTILGAVKESLVIDGVRLAADASIGITKRMEGDTRGSELLRRADVAMYQAKRTRSGSLLYDAQIDEFSREKLELSEELRKAITDDQLIVWYQPKIDAATTELCGIEALVRWRHPKHGLVSPGLFLPAARQAGLMQMLSDEVGRLTVEDMRIWERHGFTPQVSINCAPPELMAGIFIPGLAERLVQAQIPASRMVIEVTEESFLAEPERARLLMQDLSDQGFEIAIDDYGTGFSSLSYLRDLPVHELKLDRSLITGLSNDVRTKMIVSSTLQLAHALGLRVVAEGVEDGETSADLIAMGFDILQGYYLGRPMPPDDLVTWAAARTPFGSAITSGSDDSRQSPPQQHQLP